MSEYRSGYISSHALIVGINTYSDPRFMPLGQAESDAQAMAGLLGAPPYNFDITLILGSEATKSAILRALNQLRRAQADDRVLVYFAGHGYTLSDRLGNETGFLACADTIPEEDFSALELENVISLTRHTEAKHVGFIFDACFSGQALGLTRAPSVTADKLMQRRAYQVISAGAGDQTVSDYSSMTGRIVEALQSGALMSDGLVTMGELGLHVQQTITSDSHQTQIPQFGHIRGSQGGDFVFFVDTAVRLPADLEDLLRSSRSSARMSGVVELIELANDDSNELSQVARERLTSIMQSDPDERVREAAQSFFDEVDADRETAEARRELERREEESRRRREQARSARDLTPKGMRKPQEVSPESEPEPEPDTEDAWTTVPEPLPRLNLRQPAAESTPAIETPPAPAPAPVISMSKTVDVNVAQPKAAPRAAKSSLPLPLILGIGGIIGVIAIIAVIAMLAPKLLGGSADNDNQTNTQVADNDNQQAQNTAANTPDAADPVAALKTNGNEVTEAFLATISRRSEPGYSSESGSMPHNAVHVTQIEALGAYYDDFWAEVTFVNEHASGELWSIGLSFRESGSGRAYWLIISNDAKWELQLSDIAADGTLSIRVINAGSATTFNTDRNDSNKVLVIAKGDKGLFYLNDEPISIIDLSDLQVAGEIAAGIGWYSNDVIRDELKYLDFSVYGVD